MRKLLLILLAVLALTSCTSVPWAHWPGSGGSSSGGGQQTVVWLMIAPDAVHPNVEDAVNWAAYGWSVASPNVEVRWRSGDWCANYPWERCAQVYLGTVEASYGVQAITSMSVDGNGHMLNGTYVQFDFGILDRWPYTAARQLGCHETGHVLGLDHYPGNPYGPCEGAWPTQVDVGNVASSYGNHSD